MTLLLMVAASAQLVTVTVESSEFDHEHPFERCGLNQYMPKQYCTTTECVYDVYEPVENVKDVYLRQSQVQCDNCRPVYESQRNCDLYGCTLYAYEPVANLFDDNYRAPVKQCSQTFVGNQIVYRC